MNCCILYETNALGDGGLDILKTGSVITTLAGEVGLVCSDVGISHLGIILRSLGVDHNLGVSHVE